jgi:hypothetical protein
MKANNNQTGDTPMTTKQIDDIKRLLAEATPGPLPGDLIISRELATAAVNALPSLLADLDEVIRDRNEWADSTRCANQRMREAEDRVKLLRCDLEAAQKREQVLREALQRVDDENGRHFFIDEDIAAEVRKALATTEVQP